MFIQNLNKNNFKNLYLENFNVRFTLGSLTVEDEYVNNTYSGSKIYNNMEAMKNILKIDKISPYDVVDIANIVNKEIKDLSSGFRKTEVYINNSSMQTEEPRYIREALYSLFNNYYKIWNILPIYEKEAMFHREFIRIHPFEDGNGRTARIITNYNLMKDDRAPIVISKEERKKYFDFIQNNNIKGFTKFIEDKSKEELEVMLQLYRNICGGNFDDKDEDGKENLKIYEIRHSK